MLLSISQHGVTAVRAFDIFIYSIHTIQDSVHKSRTKQSYMSINIICDIYSHVFSSLFITETTPSQYLFANILTLHRWEL